jgi:hypothetical protein
MYDRTAIPEVLAIGGHLKQRAEPNELDAVRRRIEGDLERIEGWPREQRPTIRHLCPLVVDSTCPPYEVCPLAFRGWNNLDLSKCEEDFRHPEQKGASTIWIPLLEITMNVRLGTYAGLRIVRLQHHRVAFVADLKTALDVPDAATRWLAGEPLLGTEGVV